MTSFSSLLSSIGVQASTPQDTPATSQRQDQRPVPERRLTSTPTGPSLAPNNVAAGVKRKAESTEDGKISKTPAVEQSSMSRPSGTASGSRFQLSGKSGVGQKAATIPPRPISRPVPPSNMQKSNDKFVRSPALATATTVSAANSARNAAPLPKRGFASLMEKAKAAQEVAQVTASSGIKHKAADKLSKRERQRLLEEQKAKQLALKQDKVSRGAGDQNSASTGDRVVAQPAPKKGKELSYKGTMKRAAPLSYKGTMRASVPGDSKAAGKKKSQPEGKYGGYASWSDLDDAEDDEEGWGSEGSSDMEGGFDDMEKEEMLALRTARKEDQEALEEEEKHQREKMERKRRLQQLSKTAAAKKRF